MNDPPETDGEGDTGGGCNCPTSKAISRNRIGSQRSPPDILKCHISYWSDVDRFSNYRIKIVITVVAQPERSAVGFVSDVARDKGGLMYRASPGHFRDQTNRKATLAHPLHSKYIFLLYKSLKGTVFRPPPAFFIYIFFTFAFIFITKWNCLHFV